MASWLRRNTRPGAPAVEAAWASLARCARALDEGARALLATVPTARRPGVPLEAGVAGFLAGLEAARAELPGWALPELAEAQRAASAALDGAARCARALPAVAARLDFEHRNQAVGAVLDELTSVGDAVGDAETALRALRRR